MGIRRTRVVRGVILLAVVALLGGLAPASGAARSPARGPAQAHPYQRPSAAGLARGLPPVAAQDVARSLGRVARAAGRARPVGMTHLGLTPCSDDPAFWCGTLEVPLDRRHPDGRVVHLHVEVFPHTGPAAQPAGAVLVTEGGPGVSVSLNAKYGYAYFLLADVATTRDLVFVDPRGVGLSDVVDCPAWQHGGPFYRSAAACHDQLGDAANLYSTTDVADDFDDVRRALGFDRIDVLGGSYAGTDMLTYVTRHARHVRSLVIGSPQVNVGADPFFADIPEWFPVLVDDLCGRSPACAAANPDPAGALSWLAQRLRRAPLSGVGVDSSGVSHRVTVTENRLAQAILFYGGSAFVGPGTVVQAAQALRGGDPTPLLRLAADADPGGVPDSGDPREYSNGIGLATFCVDAPMQWDKQADPATRARQYAAAYAAEPAYYGPFSKQAFDEPGYRGFQPSPCIASRWEDRPNYPAGTKVTGVPSLVLAGEYDVPSQTRRATDVLVGATFVEMAAAGHVPWWYSSCGPELVQRFITTLHAGDTSCAAQPAAGWWMPGSFPVTAATAPAATQTSGPGSSDAVRRLVTVAAWTVMDGVEHNFSVPGPVSAELRGGTVTGDPATGTLTFDDARFTRDVAVSGTVTWLDELDGDLTVRSGSRVLSMHLGGPFLAVGGEITVTFELAGQPLAFTVPAY